MGHPNLYTGCRRSEWQRLSGLQLSEFIIPDPGHLGSLEGFTVQELKDTEETVVYLTTDSDLGLVTGSVLEGDIEGQVNIQSLPLGIDTEVHTAVVFFRDVNVSNFLSTKSQDFIF